MTPEQLAQFQKSVASALAANPDVARYSGVNTADTILNAYTTGDWSNIIGLSGKPFTRQQQQDAVAQAGKALAPAYKAQESFDRSVVTDTLGQEQQGYDQFRDGEALAFKDEKNTQDQNAADQGVLFSGSRFQKLNDLRSNYQDRDAQARGIAEGNIRSTARDYQYKYGDAGARSIRDMYKLPGQTNYNANVANGKVTQNKTLSAAYNPTEFKFQGTAPVSQQAAIQTRAASLLANRANKLTSTGYKNSF